MSKRTVVDCDVCGVKGLPDAYRISLASGGGIDVCEGCEVGAYPKLLKLVREADAAAAEAAKSRRSVYDIARAQTGIYDQQAVRSNCTCLNKGFQTCPVHGGYL